MDTQAQDSSEIKQDISEIEQGSDEMKLDSGGIKQDSEAVEREPGEIKQDNDVIIQEPLEIKQDSAEIKQDSAETKQEDQRSSGSSSGLSSDEDDRPRLPMRRTYRVPQKNRYYQDFHCTDLTRGGRSKLDDCDSSAATADSSRRQQEDPESCFQSKYCRRCMSRTVHDTHGCQICIWRKVVESSKRQKPSSQKSRSTNSRRQQDTEAKSAPSTNTITNSNKRKATKQGGSKISNNINNIIKNNHSNNDPIDNTNADIPEAVAATTNNLHKKINTTVGVNIVNNDDSNKLPRLDSWTPDEVAEYITSKGFAHEAELFKTQSVDGISLLLMQRTDFTYGLKIKLGPALKIYDQVCKLKKEYFRTVPVSQQ